MRTGSVRSPSRVREGPHAEPTRSAHSAQEMRLTRESYHRTVLGAVAALRRAAPIATAASAAISGTTGAW